MSKKNSFLLSHGRCLWGSVLPAVALSGGLLLSGCVVAPVGPAYAAYPGGDGVVAEAPYAPPPLQTEIIPIAPMPLSVWIGGYWGWGGGGYHWNPGRWAAPPRPGYAWQPHRWSPGPNGRWHLQGGRWVPRR